LTTHTTRQTPAHLGPAAWAEILGKGPIFGRLETNITADVVVIGAGFAGLSAARRLHQIDPTLRVAIVEAGNIAQGATGRNSGFMIDVPHDLTSDDYAGQNDKALIALNRTAQDFGARAVEDYAISPAYFDRAGKINGAKSHHADAHNTALAEHLATMNEPSEKLDAQQMRAITGSSYYTSGLYTPGTVMLQPAGYVRGFATGLARDGVSILENSAVTQLTRVSGDWVVKTNHGQITAKHVILSVNGHLESFGFARQRLMHVFLFATMTPDLPKDVLGGDPRWGITPSDPMGTTVRRIDTAQGGNRIVTRTCAVLRPSMQARNTDLKRALKIMRRKFDDRFPNLSDVKMEHSWAGHLCLSRNGVGCVGEVDQGIVAACVQNGLGTTRGTLAGIAAAETVLGQSSDVTQPFQQIGANVYLRYKEWRARSE